MNDSEALIGRRIENYQNFLSRQLQQALLREYRKVREAAAAEDMIARCSNGKVVIQKIETILETVYVKENIADAIRDERFEELFMMEEDERYKSCSESVRNAKRIVDYLFHSRFCDFGVKERAEHANYLNSRDKMCANWTREYCKAKKELVKFMAALPGSPMRLYDAVYLYYSSLHQQLRAQHEIMKREADLSEMFLKFSKSLVAGHLDMLKKKVKSSQKKEIVIGLLQKAAMLMKNNSFFNVKADEEEDIYRLQSMISQSEGAIRNRRKELAVIEKAINTLEKILSHIDEKREGRELPSPAKTPAPAANGGAKASRMSYAAKLKGLFGRFRRGKA